MAVKLNDDQERALAELKDLFTLNADRIQKIVDQFLWEFNEGLSKIATVEDQDTYLPMIPTFLSNVPNGTETGRFLALDLGGTNLRVCAIDLMGDHTFKIRNEKYRVTDALKTGEATDLFDHIASCVQRFLDQEFPDHASESGEKIYLGFTFSFPVHQTALDKGTLLTWTKGFEAKNAKGKDVVKLLQDALDRRGVKVTCSALVNDTVGTMLSRAYAQGTAAMGVIFGTGTNAAYLERAENIKTLKNEGDRKVEHMIVNTEWGAFDNERVVLPVTFYDSKLDRESINPRKQAFEKMISGMYLGEILRNILCHSIDRFIIFGGHSSRSLDVHYGLDTEVMSAIEAEAVNGGQMTAENVERIRKVLVSELHVEAKHISDADCLFVQQASELVGTRAAHLSGAALAAVIRQTKYTENSKDPFAVGVDGSVVQYYPRFEQRVRQAVRMAVGEGIEKKVEIGLAQDGSGVGAALCALQAKKQAEAHIKTTEK